MKTDKTIAHFTVVFVLAFEWKVDFGFLQTLYMQTVLTKKIISKRIKRTPNSSPYF